MSAQKDFRLGNTPCRLDLLPADGFPIYYILLPKKNIQHAFFKTAFFTGQKDSSDFL